MGKRLKRGLLPKSKLFSKKKKKLNPQSQLLGLGPKFIESVRIGLHDDDLVHVRKMVDGLSEYGQAKRT